MSIATWVQNTVQSEHNVYVCQICHVVFCRSLVGFAWNVLASKSPTLSPHFLFVAKMKEDDLLFTWIDASFLFLFLVTGNSIRKMAKVKSRNIQGPKRKRKVREKLSCLFSFGKKEKLGELSCWNCLCLGEKIGWSDVCAARQRHDFVFCRKKTQMLLQTAACLSVWG